MSLGSAQTDRPQDKHSLEFFFSNLLKCQETQTHSVHCTIYQSLNIVFWKAVYSQEGQVHRNRHQITKICLARSREYFALVYEPDGKAKWKGYWENILNRISISPFLVSTTNSSSFLSRSIMNLALTSKTKHGFHY